MLVRVVFVCRVSLSSSSSILGRYLRRHRILTLPSRHRALIPSLLHEYGVVTFV